MSSLTSSSLNSQETECSICGSVREKVKLIPCSHDGLCLLCARRIPDAKCPFCRSSIQSVNSMEGTYSFKKLHSRYIAEEKRDLKETVQFSLFGPSAEDNKFMLDFLVYHSDEKVSDNVDRTKYSPNCSYHNLKSRITVQILPQGTGVS